MDNTLTLHEKKITMEDLFPHEKQYIENIGTHLSDTFSKIDGFDYRWNSLITSKPLLFEDTDYVRVRSFINNECTKEEIEAYKRGELRELYATFESMLMCNIEFYDRIMRFCTMVFLRYIRMPDDLCSTHNLNKIPYFIDMTPTKIWCCAMTSTKSTEWELNYAWNYSRKNIIKFKQQVNNKSLLELNYSLLYKNIMFARFVEYSSLYNGTTGYLQTLFNDKTSNNRLSKVCSKFTKTSTAVDSGQLETIIDYVYDNEEYVSKLYSGLSESLDTEFISGQNYAIWVFKNEFFIFTDKFKMRVYKDDYGKISKDYLSNSYECFAAEILLSDSVKHQLNWAKHKDLEKFNYDKQLLKTILSTMLKENHRDIKCVKFMPENGVYSEITFKASFNWFRAIEKFYFHGNVIHEYKKNFGVDNMVEYIINRGYYLFGTTHDIDIMFVRDITKDVLIEHYSSYCVPVLQHLQDVRSLYLKNNNDIIDVLVKGFVNPLKINNKNIKYTRLKGNKINNRDIMYQMKKLTNNITTNKGRELTYYNAIND